MALNETPTSAPAPKVVWGAAGGVLGGAVATLALGFMRRRGIVLDPEEIGALTTLITVVFGFAGGYITPPKGFQGNFPSAAVVGLLVCLGASACSSLGMQGAQAPADTPRKQLLVLEYSYAGALNTIVHLINTGAIKGETAKEIEEYKNQTSAAINAAEVAVSGGNPANTIALANAALTQLLLSIEEKTNGGQRSQEETNPRGNGYLAGSASDLWAADGCRRGNGGFYEDLCGPRARAYGG
jgi:hypothetical protein